jgi:hypothetical protein
MSQNSQVEDLTDEVVLLALCKESFGKAGLNEYGHTAMMDICLLRCEVQSIFIKRRWVA